MGELQMTQAKRWTFDEQESEKDVQQRGGAASLERRAKTLFLGWILSKDNPFRTKVE